MKPTRSQIRATAALRRGIATMADWRTKNIAGDGKMSFLLTAMFVHNHGQEYYADGASFRGPRGESGACFRNSGQLALEPGGPTYVEGYAATNGVPFEHAWCTDGGGHVIEPTIRNSPLVYFGVEFTTDYLRATILRTETWGLLSEIQRSATKKRTPRRVPCLVRNKAA